MSYKNIFKSQEKQYKFYKSDNIKNDLMESKNGSNYGKFIWSSDWKSKSYC